jgi:hypothetical protein
MPVNRGRNLQRVGNGHELITVLRQGRQYIAFWHTLEIQAAIRHGHSYSDGIGILDEQEKQAILHSTSIIRSQVIGLWQCLKADSRRSLMNAIASSKNLGNSEPKRVPPNLPGSPKIPSAIPNQQRNFLVSSRKTGLWREATRAPL